MKTRCVPSNPQIQEHYGHGFSENSSKIPFAILAILLVMI